MNEDEAPVCRICYDEQSIEPDKVFISPCSCSGEQLFVHKGCLNQWIKGDMHSETYFKCATCKFNYKRSKPTNFDDEINKKTLLSILTVESGLFIFLLLFILGCNNSNTFCSFAIFILYISSLTYICGNLGYEEGFWLIVVMFFCAICTGRKTKLCITNTWLILFFGLISSGLVTNGWDLFKRQIEKTFLIDFKPQMLDKYLGIYVDGIF